MSYKSKHGITQIKSSEKDNLSLSWDSDYPTSAKYPVMLFIPDINHDGHYHIQLSTKEAKVVHEWLGEFLKEKAKSSKKKKTKKA